MRKKTNKKSKLSGKRKRKAIMMQGGCSSIFLMAFSVPAVVILTYHIFGWKFAVLLFPIAIFLWTKALGARRSGQRKKWDGVTKRAFQIGMWCVPICAVAFDEIQIMRLWAVFMAVLPAEVAFEKPDMFSDQVAFPEKHKLKLQILFAVLFAGSFIALSEVVWNFFGQGPWIWFHALFFFAFVVFMLLLIGIMSLLLYIFPFLRTRSEQPSVKNVNPPRRPDGDRSEALELSIRLNDGNWLKYEEASLGQTSRIFNEMDWADELANDLLGDKQKPNENGLRFHVELGGFFEFYVEPSTNDTADVCFRYQIDRKSWQLFGDVIYRKTANVPMTMVPQLLPLAWKDNWVELETVLADYMVKA